MSTGSGAEQIELCFLDPVFCPAALPVDFIVEAVGGVAEIADDGWHWVLVGPYDGGLKCRLSAVKWNRPDVRDNSSMPAVSVQTPCE